MSHIFWGIVDGQSTSKAFSVRMDLHHKEVKSSIFDHIPADELKCAIPDNPGRELEPIELKYLGSHSRLRATDRLAKLFGNNWHPTDGTIDFIVHRPFHNTRTVLRDCLRSQTRSENVRRPRGKAPPFCKCAVVDLLQSFTQTTHTPWPLTSV